MRSFDGKPQTEDVDIDVAAIIRRGQDRIVLFGECRFKNRAMRFTTLNTLRERIDTIKGGYNERLALFSTSGFDDDLDILVGKRGCPEIPEQN